MTKAFYAAADHLGNHSYFRTLGDAQFFQAAYGGTIYMTTTNRIWRVTTPI